MMWCGQSRMPLLDAQHSKDAGWTGRTHSTPHIMHVTCGLDNTKGVEDFVEDSRRTTRHRTRSRCTATTLTTLIWIFLTYRQSSTGFQKHAPSLQHASLRLSWPTPYIHAQNACLHAQTHTHAFSHVLHTDGKHAQGTHAAHHVLQGTFGGVYAFIEIVTVIVCGRMHGCMWVGGWVCVFVCTQNQHHNHIRPQPNAHTSPKTLSPSCYFNTPTVCHIPPPLSPNSQTHLIAAVFVFDLLTYTVHLISAFLCKQTSASLRNVCSWAWM